MKKHISIILLSILTLAFASCNDYLDHEPENQKGVDDVDYTQIKDMFNPVSGVYATARGEKGFGAWTLYSMLTVRGYDTYKGSAPGDQVELNYCKNFQYKSVQDYWLVGASWNSLFYLVQASNSAIEQLDRYGEHTTTEAEKKLNAQYIAEVQTIRALAYFYITHLWGDVPVFTDNSVVEGSETPKLVPHKEVLQFIVDQTEEASKNLPALRPNEMTYKGQITMYTALMLQAKAASLLDNWDLVLSATNTIVGSGKFQLYDNFYQAFKKPGRLSNESILEWQTSDFGSPTGEIVKPDQWFVFQGPRGTITGPKKIGGGWGFMCPTDEIVKLFEKRGETVRATTTLLKVNATTPSGDFIAATNDKEPTVYNGKAYLPSNQLTDGREDYGTGNNIRMMRYAETLLLNAEAKVRKGESADTEFNLVRKRAQMDEITGVTLDQILEERQIELAMEWGNSFMDLVRTKKASSVLPKFVEGQSEFYMIPLEQIEIYPEWDTASKK